MIKEKDMEFKNSLMEPYIKGNGNKIKEKAMGCKKGLMELFTKECGKEAR
jgi:hypothetical protein